MLKRVLARLAAAGWFDTGRPFETSINFTQGACVWLLLTRGGRSDTHVKFSEHLSLQREAQRCAAASHNFLSLVPGYVGHIQEAGLEILVCKAVEYRNCHSWWLQHTPGGARVLKDLVRYFAATTTTPLPPGLAPVRNATLIDDMAVYFQAHPLSHLAGRLLSGEAAQRAMALPDTPQHGDLVLNNIGRKPDGWAVVFDWEDYGASNLRGLDLFTLELSLAGAAKRLLAGRQSPREPLQRFMRAACEAMHLELATYHALTPVYALVFRYLKRNYGPGVRARMDELLLEIDQRSMPAGA